MKTLKKIYFNVFLNKKYFESSLLSQSQINPNLVGETGIEYHV